MVKNPVVSALLASGYITLVATVMQLGAKVSRPEDTFLGPIAFISVFTLSAAVMVYLFGFAPATLYLDGKKKEAVKHFLQTLASFGVITIALLVLVFSGVLTGKM